MATVEELETQVKELRAQLDAASKKPGGDPQLDARIAKLEATLARYEQALAKRQQDEENAEKEEAMRAEAKKAEEAKATAAVAVGNGEVKPDAIWGKRDGWKF